MLSLYELLKASKGLPVSDSYAALWGKSAAESGIKTLTGRLPLFFSTTEIKLRDWVIYGNNDVGKNLLEITAESQTIDGVTFTVDKQAGTISIDGTVPSSKNVDLQLLRTGEILTEPQTFIASIDSIAPDSKAYLGFRKRKQSGGISYITVFPSSSVTITLGEGEYIDLVYIAARKEQTLDNVSVKPMIRLTDTSSDFEPYQIGVGERTRNRFDIDTSTMVQINSQGHLRYGVSIGSALAGTYILSFTNTSADMIYVTTRKGTTYSQSIAITVSPHTITLNNNVDELIVRTTSPTMTTWERLGFTNIMLVEGSTAPDHYIPYGYQIPLTISQQGQTDKTYDIYIGDSPLTEGETVSKSSTGVDIELFEGENTVSTTLYNKPDMEIKYK